MLLHTVADRFVKLLKIKRLTPKHVSGVSSVASIFVKQAIANIQQKPRRRSTKANVRPVRMMLPPGAWFDDSARSCVYWVSYRSKALYHMFGRCAGVPNRRHV